MKNTSLILLWLISMISLSFCFKEPILRQNTTPIHVKFKSIKCNVADPSVVKIPFCHIKPLSRLHSSMNVGLILKKIIYGPLEVVLSVNYRHGTIYRQMKKRTFNYCELFKNGSFISKNPVHMVMFLMLKDRLPDFAYNGCPFPAGAFNITNFTIPERILPFSQMIPSGTYKIIANISSRKKLLGYGFGTGEVTTLLKTYA